MISTPIITNIESNKYVKYLTLDIIPNNHEKSNHLINNEKKYRKSKYTVSFIIQEGTKVHNDTVDYSLVKDCHITNGKSNIPLICKICNYGMNGEWSPQIYHHLKGSRCPCCVGVAPWTYERFIYRSKQINGIKYNYDKVTPEHICNKYSRVPLICNTCNYGINGEWTPTISVHINDQSGCPKCADNRWTFDRLIKEAIKIHGTTVNYSRITPESIINAYSRISIICNLCDYGMYNEWNPTITEHINNKSSCPSCYGNASWTYDRFIRKVFELNKGRYSYELIEPNQIINANSLIPLICNDCNYGYNGEWTSTIRNHIHNHLKVNFCCPSCSGKIKYTYDNFIIRAKLVHGDNCNYKLIKQEHIQGKNSKIPIICNRCYYGSNGEWTPTISEHIRGAQCPNCKDVAPWTLERFLIEALSIHKGKYDYRFIIKEDIKGRNSKIPILCTKCNKLSYPSINSHIHAKSGCKYCRFSKGELGVANILEKHNLKFIPQYSIPDLPNRYYDFMIILNDINILIEFDGQQHFQYIAYFDKGDYNTFLIRQEADRIKTDHALNSGYYMIRIDYNEISNIEKHILSAIDMFTIESRSKLYLSNIDLYNYLNLK
jgi:very-short-patch-repair endonuclease